MYLTRFHEQQTVAPSLIPEPLRALVALLSAQRRVVS